MLSATQETRQPAGAGARSSRCVAKPTIRRPLELPTAASRQRAEEGEGYEALPVSLLR
jgi:hypothetical protein